MSRICRRMGNLGKLLFYELDHESKVWLLKTHSRTSNGLAMELGTGEEKYADPTTRQKPPIKNLPRTAGMAGGGAGKDSEPAA